MEAFTPIMKENTMLINQRDKWVESLSKDQYNCLQTTLNELSQNDLNKYDVSNFPISFIKTFDEAFNRKDWLTNLSENQLDYVKTDLNKEKYLCPTLFCCGCCSTCNGDGKITYQLHNFPFEWINKYNKLFETEKLI